MFIKRPLELKISILVLVTSTSCFVIHFLFFRHSFPPVNVDEASFFSPAYSLAKHGNLSSNIHQSFLPGSSIFTYWMPPLYLVLLGAFLKLLGTTVLNAKVLSIILSSISALIVYNISADKYTRNFTAALFLICPFIIITSAFIRVEALSILLIVLSIAAIRFNVKEYIIGIIAGLGIMTHPLLIPAVAGLSLVVLRKGVRVFIIFSIVTLITITPYIIYILQDVELYKEQMALQLARKSKVKLSDLKLSYLVQSVPFALIAFFCLYRVKQLLELRIFLAVALLLSMFIILRSNEFNYQVYIVPYVIASVALVMQEYKHKFLYRLILPLVLYVSFALLLFSKLIKYHTRDDREYKELITYVSENDNWNGKKIFVSGSPDVATFLLMKNQDVERQIPIANTKSSDWFNKYNYVFEVTDNLEENNLNNDSTNNEKPWRTWKVKKAFTTSKGSHSLFSFIKE